MKAEIRSQDKVKVVAYFADANLIVFEPVLFTNYYSHIDRFFSIWVILEGAAKFFNSETCSVVTVDVQVKEDRTVHS